jgi:hypothetical protein
MANYMLTRRTVITAKKETVEGTDSAPTPTTDAILAVNPTVEMRGNPVNRPIVTQTFSKLGQVIGTRSGQISFGTEYRGIDAIPSAASPLAENPLFLACGMSPTYAASSAIYKPLTDFGATVNSVTIWAYLDGLLHAFNGCRGSFSFDATVGAIPTYQWTFQGTFTAINLSPTGTDGVRDVTFPASVTYQAYSVQPPMALGATLTAYGYSAVARQITFDMKNDVQGRESLAAPNGLVSYYINGRDPGGTLDPEAVTRGTSDFWYRWVSAAKGAISFSLGQPVASGDGKVQFDAPAVQLGAMTYADRNGIRNFNMPYSCAGNTTAGDDEVTITYS